MIRRNLLLFEFDVGGLDHFGITVEILDVEFRDLFRRLRRVQAQRAGGAHGAFRMEVEVVRSRSTIFKFKGVAKVGDKVAAEAEFAAMVVETPKA